MFAGEVSLGPPSDVRHVRSDCIRGLSPRCLREARSRGSETGQARVAGGWTVALMGRWEKRG